MSRREIHWPECDRKTCTLREFNHPTTEAQTAHARGWKVGDVLEGDEGHGVTRIRLTAIGEERILARDAERADRWESLWTFDCRCWRKVATL